MRLSVISVDCAYLKETMNGRDDKSWQKIKMYTCPSPLRGTQINKKWSDMPVGRC